MNVICLDRLARDVRHGKARRNKNLPNRSAYGALKMMEYIQCNDSVAIGNGVGW